MFVTTNELPSAGTTAQISITVYGHKKKSDPIPLGSNTDGEYFQPGSIDEFDVGCFWVFYDLIKLCCLYAKYTMEA